MVADGNLYAELPPVGSPETLTELIATPHARVERIVSRGQASPPGFWYDQDWDEWVVLLAGSAGLLIDGEDKARRLGPGDFLHLPAHVRHRVAWTDEAQATVWLAVHLS
jgi:cupin 2 domain-containing protein